MASSGVVHQEFVPCPKCGESLSIFQSECPYCGTYIGRVERPAVAAEKQRSKVAKVRRKSNFGGDIGGLKLALLTPIVAGLSIFYSPILSIAEVAWDDRFQSGDSPLVAALAQFNYTTVWQLLAVIVAIVAFAIYSEQFKAGTALLVALLASIAATFASGQILPGQEFYSGLPIATFLWAVWLVTFRPRPHQGEDVNAVGGFILIAVAAGTVIFLPGIHELIPAAMTALLGAIFGYAATVSRA